MQHVETVPAVLHHAEALGGLARQTEQRRAVFARQYARPDDQHRPFGAIQHIGEAVVAAGQRAQRVHAIAQMVAAVGQVGRFADQADLEPACPPAPPDARVENRGLDPRVGPYQQQRIGLVDAGDAAVEQVACAQRRIDLGPVLAAVDVGRAQGCHEVLQRDHRLGVGMVAGDRRGSCAADPGEFIGYRGEGLGPGRRLQPAVPADIGPIETLPFQAVAGEAGLVGDPLLVDVVVQARQHPHDLGAAAVDPNVGADGIHDVDRFGLAQFPGPRREGIGLGGQRADRAQVDHVAGEFGGQRALQISRDLHMLAAMERADFLDARNFFGKADAAGAMDAAGHDRLDQRPHFLVVHRALVFLEAGAVVAVGHRLVLQVAFAALVADRAVERMVDQQEFHHAPAGLDRLFRIRKDDHAVQDRLGAGGDRLGRPLHLHQAHAAVAGNRQPFVEAEMRHFLADRLQRLEQGQAPVDLMLFAVDGDRCHRAHAATLRCRIRRSSSGRKCRIRPWIGQAAASPSAQIVCPSTW